MTSQWRGRTNKVGSGLVWESRATGRCWAGLWADTVQGNVQILCSAACCSLFQQDGAIIPTVGIAPFTESPAACHENGHLQWLHEQCLMDIIFLSVAHELIMLVLVITQATRARRRLQSCARGTSMSQGTRCNAYCSSSWTAVMPPTPAARCGLSSWLN